MYSSHKTFLTFKTTNCYHLCLNIFKYTWYDKLWLPRIKLCIGRLWHKWLCFLKFSLILYDSDRKMVRDIHVIRNYMYMYAIVAFIQINLWNRSGETGESNPGPVAPQVGSLTTTQPLLLTLWHMILYMQNMKSLSYASKG